MKDYDPELVDPQAQGEEGFDEGDGELDPERLPEPEAKDPAPHIQARYDLLERLLLKGFLDMEVTLGPNNFIRLKTLTPQEFQQCFEIAPLFYTRSDIDKDSATQKALLAMSLYRLNGRNLLLLREREDFKPLVTLVNHLPQKLFLSLSQKLDSLLKASARLAKLLLPYSYGPPSRRIWESLKATYKGTPFLDPKVTGIPGTNFIGIHPATEAWYALNTNEDKYSDFQNQYSLAKLMISPHASKDIQRIDKQEKLAKYHSLTHKYLCYEHASINLDAHTQTTDEAGRTLVSPTTTKELLYDMEKSVRGEKDFHDLVVQQHEKRIAQAIEEERRRVDELRRLSIANQYRQEQEELDNIPGLIILTPEDTARRAEEIRQRKLERIRNSDNPLPQLDEREERAMKWNIIPPKTTK